MPSFFNRQKLSIYSRRQRLRVAGFLERVRLVLSNNPSVLQITLRKSLSDRMPFAPSPDTIVQVVIRNSGSESQVWERQLLGHFGCLQARVEHAPGFHSCLYADPTLRIDFEFVTRQEADRLLASGDQAPHLEESNKTLANNDKLIWIWLHSAIAMLHRGELFEVLRRLNSIRSLVLKPLIAKIDGHAVRAGVRRFEMQHPAWIRKLASTVATYSYDSCRKALSATIDLYMVLREQAALADLPSRTSVQQRILLFLQCPPAKEEPDHPGGTPPNIAALVAAVLRLLRDCGAVLGAAVGGSWLGPSRTTETGKLDPYSDFDLWIVTGPTECRDLSWQDTFINQIAPAFLSHRMNAKWVRCLFSRPEARADIQFLTLSDLQARFENPRILFERNRLLTHAIATSEPSPDKNMWLQHTSEWIEPRFWLALYDCTQRLMRGELFQVAADLSWIRSELLGPMLAIRACEPSRGVRRIEFRFPEWVYALRETVPAYDSADFRKALHAAIDLFRRLRQLPPGFLAGAERAVVEQLEGCP